MTKRPQSRANNITAAATPKPGFGRGGWTRSTTPKPSPPAIRVAIPSTPVLKKAPKTAVTNLKTSQRRARQARITPAGKAWLRLYLNPMGKDDPNIIGYPDGSAVRTVLGDYRQDFNVAMPDASHVNVLANRTLHPFTQEQYDATVGKWGQVTLLFLALPTARHVAMVRIYPTTPTTVIATNDLDVAVPIFPQFCAWPGDGSKSSTTDVGFLQSFIQLENVSDHLDACSGFRLIARGNTGIFTVPKLEEQGFITSAQYLTTHDTVPLTDDYIVDGAINDSKLTLVHQQAVARLILQYSASNTAPSALVDTYHNAYTNKCTDGWYAPIMNSARDNPFRRADPYPISVAGDSWNSVAYNDDPCPGWNTSVTWVEGVSRNFSIKYKHRSVFQYVAKSGSVLANFTRQEPEDDEVALQAAWHMRNKMSHAYPSCYNDWGWLGDLIDAGISMIPGVGTVYNLAKPLIKPAWNWLGGKVSDYFGNPVAKDGDIYFDA